MSIIDYKDVKVSIKKRGKKEELPPSLYQPTEDEKKRIAEVVANFALGWNILQKPRREFNDLSAVGRMTVDQMLFNTYQPNDGEAAEGDDVNGWKSRAMRPIVRNKVISIAAHATARTIFPKIFAQNEHNEEQKDAATVMADLMEWAGDQQDYTKVSLFAVLNALVSPLSIVHQGYSETYRKVKKIQDDGGYKEEMILDEDLSGFQATIVPMNEFMYADFFEENIQKQPWIIWRKVINYDLAKAKYAHKYKNFEHVKQGVQTVYVDANSNFYEVYDSNMRSYEVEEVLYWNKNEDLFLIMVNGVLLTSQENPNPRNDKLFPFVGIIFEPLTDTKSICGKSLVFKMAPDARIINTLYPMIIDGTYLNLFPPMIAMGAETIGTDVIVPGAVTTFSDPNANLKPINLATNVAQGFQTASQVERSINESSQEPLQQGGRTGSRTTAYEISRIEQNAATVLGLFVKMIGGFVKQYGRLLLGDVLQYLTIADASKITGDNELTYKAFIFPDKESGVGKTKTRKIMFDGELPSEEVAEREIENMSFDILQQEGGKEGDVEIFKVNPELMRNLKYMLRISPDVLTPKSEDLERAFNLELYDRAIGNPLIDQNAVTRDFLLAAYPKSKKNPDKYLTKGEMMPGAGMGGQGRGPESPLQALLGRGAPPNMLSTDGGFGGFKVQ
jgi:hypothetical protein